MGKKKKSSLSQPGTVTLRDVADRLGLAPGTVSIVLNNAPSASAIPERTRQRIHAAALDLNYRPNFLARSLRKQRTYTVGLMIEEIGDAYGSLVISGVEAYLQLHNYFFLTVIHRHDAARLREHSQLLLERGVEGFITVDTSLEGPLPFADGLRGRTPVFEGSYEHRFGPGARRALSTKQFNDFLFRIIDYFGR
jgi:LacI family transcriptional regulator